MTLLTRSTLFQTSTPHLGHSSHKETVHTGSELWNYMIVSMMHSCFTWFVVWFFKGIQPIEAENLLPVCPLHQRELAGVNLYLSWSLTGSTFLLLSPGASNPVGPGKGERREDAKPEACAMPFLKVCTPF